MNLRAKIFMLSAVMVISIQLTAATSGDVYVSGVSKYLWRGQVLYGGFAVQPGADLSYGNFSIGVWGSISVKDAELGEADLLLNYSTSISGIEIGFGYTFYTFSNMSSDSHEVYLSAGLNEFLSPALTFYYDFDAGSGAYIEGNLNIPFVIGLKFVLTPSIGLNLSQWGYKSSLSVLGLGLSTDILLGDINITPGLFYQIALNNQYSNDGFLSATVQYNF